MTNKEFLFIIIDDSELDCFVTQKFLEYSNTKLTTKTFDNAEHALQMIRENPHKNDLISAIILLDLQMPGMDGFTFIEEFEKFPAEIKKKYSIIILTILTTTANPDELYRVLNYSSVKSIIEKPLTSDKLFSLLTQVKYGT